MSPRRKVFVAAGLVAAIAFLWTCESELQSRADATQDMVTAPAFEVDPFWPKPLPNDWLLGNAIGVHVDAQDRIWMIHRSSASLTGGESGAEQDPPTGECCVGAPPVLAFDQEGNLLEAWGGEPGEDYQGYEWPQSNHGIFVDHNGFVWIGGNGPADSHVLKLTEDGDVVAQFGEAGARANPSGQGFSGGSNDETSFGRVADVFVDSLENEAYLADGYLNKRVAVIDAESGAMQRYWGAYGNDPNDDFEFAPRGADQEPSQQFRGPVHCVHITGDRMLYVCDRQSNRVQVFTPEGEFVQESLYQPETLGEGSTWDVAFSRDSGQQYMYVADGRNQELRVVDRESMDQLYSFGQGGRYPGMWFGLHSIATDSDGNLYTTETYEGKRIQKFVYMGERQVPAGEQGAAWPTEE